MLKRTYTKLFKPLQINIFNSRSMFKLTSQPGVNIRVVRPLLHSSHSTNRSMTTITSYRFKKSAAKDLANDTNGKHPHVVKEFCEKRIVPNIIARNYATILIKHKY